MPNKKTKDDLLAEKVSAEKKLEQYTHQLQRAVNREKYLVKGEAKKRTCPLPAKIDRKKVKKTE